MAETVNMKVEVTARETIKPSSPTPNRHRSFKLSLLDQIAPELHVPLVLFYDNEASNGGGEEVAAARSQRLKASLSDVLTRFYPFAGRIKDHLSVCCNDGDGGAEYLEARVNCRLSDILFRQPDIEMLKHFSPNQYRPNLGRYHLSTDPLFLVQATFFECGGMALSMSFSHKIADATTFATFINGWASSALGYPSDAVEVTPDFGAASLFPPMDPFPVIPMKMDQSREKVISRRFVFGASQIAALQAKGASAIVPKPTRVQAVSAVVWKTAMTAKALSRSKLRPSALTCAVNLRPRLMPPLSAHSFGNLFGVLILKANVEGETATSTDLPSLISHFSRETAEFCDNYIKKLQGDEYLSATLDGLMKISNMALKADAVDVYISTSWCRLPLYEADFGWGKPTWAAVGDLPQMPNLIVLMDTRDGRGIEAWVTLIEEDMALFESNQELLTFASLNPSVS